jgi:hypothetical protein
VADDLLIWRDEKCPATWELTGPVPAGVVDVDFGDGTWHTASVDDRLATVLICGPDLDPTPGGYVIVADDCLPRVRVNGAIRTDGHIRLRPAA